ncbi:MAG: tripartite tricarboxylate transporter substrate binding protein [Rhodocyclaceae bacterium]|jgi:tripartite-type tricarboxylate transporter receptor subunit TctC|nr:tripartite tricarboxylate transporter substrate binding protein [Rhodocyclaceae bacterium]MCE2981171.1 tripartite tricarboxylate transporter substrate binding protein [Betaproteobacteria bacterium]MCA3073604.1 tripartite tricarboxylate transporter substrate binding protein [Rhodocyclaceae bacterium]MCA3089039.1 tripartite tricarboxylate transporter substrate binding protein [Rhodocyclaceae bacterium]MCA3095775.1 tripartite tricarboxylate transporter substrate binding protein [Rhodocyclaceae 
MNPTSKTLPFIAALGAASLLAMPMALAQAPRGGGDEWPSRPVRFIVPFAPGAANDLIARAVGSKLADIWGQSVLVDNRPGGGTVIGSDLVARSPADGYTLLQIGLAHAVNPSVIAKLPYDSLRDFTMVAQTGESPFVLVSNVSLPVKNVRDLVAMAKARPGTLAYGSTGSGGTSHLMGELLKSMAGIDVIHVPYKGLSPALTEVIGGQIQYSFGSWSTVGPFVKAGKLRALAVTSAKRSPVTPDLPTIAEEGFKGYDATPWWGIAGPGGIPRPLLARINTGVRTAMASSEMKERFAIQGIEIATGTPEAFLALVKSEIDRWAKIVKTAGIKAD